MIALSTFEQVELQKKLDQSSKEIERLNALVAMQADKLNKIKFLDGYDGCRLHHSAAKLLNEAIEASLSTVAKWEAEKLSDGKLYSAMSSVAVLKQNTDLQRQVAMLDEFVNHCLNAVDNLNDLPISDEWATTWVNKASDMLEKHNWYRAEKATAEAYDREHAAKVLEEAKAIADDEARIRESAGMKHPEDSPERDKCFAGARAAHNIAIELTGRISSLRATKQIKE